MTKKDLGLEVYTDREGTLIQFRDNIAARIKLSEVNLEIDRVALDHIDKEIKKEKSKRLNSKLA